MRIPAARAGVGEGHGRRGGGWGLQYIPDSHQPQQIVSGLMEAVPSGSYLVISDTTTDIGDGASRVASKINPRMGPTRPTPRPRA